MLTGAEALDALAEIRAASVRLRAAQDYVDEVGRNCAEYNSDEEFTREFYEACREKNKARTELRIILNRFV